MTGHERKLGSAFLLLAILPLAWRAEAAEQLTANTLRLATGETGARASIDAMAWLAGTWRGEGLGGWNEEIWSEPHAGTMMGMYRLVNNGATRLHELLTLTETEGSLVLTLRHFDARLHAWEERNETVTMRFIAIRDERYYFEGVTFEPRAKDGVTIYLAVEHDKGTPPREEVFRYTRVR